MEMIAWDTNEAIVEQIIDHYMYAFEPRSEWKFLTRFKGLRLPVGPEDDISIPWSKANELPAMADYSAAHKELTRNIPDDLNNPADSDSQRSAPLAGGRGVASKRRRL